MLCASRLSEIVHVTPDCLYELTNTWTWYCFGFPAANQKNVLNDTNVSEEVIIGIVDTGTSVYLYIRVMLLLVPLY